jgi:hypothetical protein
MVNKILYRLKSSISTAVEQGILPGIINAVYIDVIFLHQHSYDLNLPLPRCIEKGRLAVRIHLPDNGTIGSQHVDLRLVCVTYCVEHCGLVELVFEVDIGSFFD